MSMRDASQSHQDHFDRVLTLYDTEQHRSSLHALVSPDMVDPRVGCGAYTALILWFRGFADQARKRMEEVYALAQDLAQPYLVATALNLRTMLSQAVDPRRDCRHARRRTHRVCDTARISTLGGLGNGPPRMGVVAARTDRARS